MDVELSEEKSAHLLFEKQIIADGSRVHNHVVLTRGRAQAFNFSIELACLIQVHSVKASGSVGKWKKDRSERRKWKKRNQWQLRRMAHYSVAEGTVRNQQPVTFLRFFDHSRETFNFIAVLHAPFLSLFVQTLDLRSIPLQRLREDSGLFLGVRMASAHEVEALLQL